MPLVRKTRESGGSLVVAIPSQLVEAFELSKGDDMQIIPLKNGEIRIKKIKSGKSSTSS
jgi:antitoxin component of MazEF toxin-antitoxin module